MARCQELERTHRPSSKRLLSGIALALLATAITTGQADAAGIVWRTRFDEAAREAAAQHKPMLVMVKARWCGPCHKMLNQTFPDAGLATRVASHFVPVLIDADEHGALVKSLGVEAMPTVLVVTPERQIAGRFTGFQSAAQLDARLAAYASREVRHVARLELRPSLIQQPSQPPSPGSGPSFLKRHGVAIAPVRPDRRELSPPPWDTLAAAREFSFRPGLNAGATLEVGPPTAMAEVASPVPNPPD